MKNNYYCGGHGNYCSDKPNTKIQTVIKYLKQEWLVKITGFWDAIYPRKPYLHIHYENLQSHMDYVSKQATV